MQLLLRAPFPCAPSLAPIGSLASLVSRTRGPMWPAFFLAVLCIYCATPLLPTHLPLLVRPARLLPPAIAVGQPEGEAVVGARPGASAAAATAPAPAPAQSSVDGRSSGMAMHVGGSSAEAYFGWSPGKALKQTAAPQPPVLTAHHPAAAGGAITSTAISAAAAVGTSAVPAAAAAAATSTTVSQGGSHAEQSSASASQAYRQAWWSALWDRGQSGGMQRYVEELMPLDQQQVSGVPAAWWWEWGVVSAH